MEKSKGHFLNQNKLMLILLSSGVEIKWISILIKINIACGKAIQINEVNDQFSCNY